MNNTAQGRDFAQKAIEAALNNDWQMAIEFNSAILSGTPMDIDALIRLARAYLEIGEPKKAKEYVQNYCLTSCSQSSRVYLDSTHFIFLV